MAREQLTLRQQLNSCRTRLYSERMKNRQLKRLLEKEREFSNNLIEENTLIKKQLIKLDYYSKEE